MSFLIVLFCHKELTVFVKKNTCVFVNNNCVSSKISMFGKENTNFDIDHLFPHGRKCSVNANKEYRVDGINYFGFVLQSALVSHRVDGVNYFRFVL